MRRALLGYALAFAAIAIVARTAMIGFGFPDWLFMAPSRLWRSRCRASSSHARSGGRATGVGAFVLLITGTTALRAAGIGPFRTVFGSGALNEGDRILVDEFSVETADTVLGRALAEGVPMRSRAVPRHSICHRRADPRTHRSRWTGPQGATASRCGATPRSAGRGARHRRRCPHAGGKWLPRGAASRQRRFRPRAGTRQRRCRRAEQADRSRRRPHAQTARQNG